MNTYKIKSFELDNIFLSVNEIPEYYYVKNSLSYVLKGDYKETYERKLMTCSTGDFIIYPAGSIHFDNFNPKINRRLHISFDNEFFDKYSSLQSIFDLNGKIRNVQMTCIMQKILNELELINDCSVLMIETLIIELLIYLGRAKIDLESNIPNWLQKVIEYLHDDYANKYKLDDLAQIVNIHPAYLVNTFKYYTNQTISEYLRSIRIKNACAKLNSGLSIAQIAFNCGFADQSHLNRSFKKLMGMTPLTYRNKILTN